MSVPRVLLSSTTTQTAVQQACDVLQAGGLVIYPSETTYGIGADATNSEAIQKLLRYKGRRDQKPLSVAVSSLEMAEKFVQLNSPARQAYANFLPGPVTIVSTGKHVLASGVESSTGTVGVRISSHPFIAQLVQKFGKPITATGANASYQKRPYTVLDILDVLSEDQQKLLGLIVDAGTLPPNFPTTVIDTTLDDVQVLRQGEVQFSRPQQYVSTSPLATQRLGKELIQVYRNYFSYKSILICLEGPMGAGKTQFVKGIAEGCGVNQEVVSPTYSIAREYPFFAEGQHVLFVHIDTWRLSNTAELADLRLSELIQQKAVVAIEWAEKFSDFLRSQAKDAVLIWVRGSYGAESAQREFTYEEL